MKQIRQRGFDSPRIKKIGIIGAGWYGAYTAYYLAMQLKKLKDVIAMITLFDKAEDAMGGISGLFGVRLHRGPHYPRSEKTRRDCHNGLDQFLNDPLLKLLVLNLEYAIYALGKQDAEGFSSKVSVEDFKKVCHEAGFIDETESPNTWGYTTNVLYAAKLLEPAAIVGGKLRRIFNCCLKEAGVTVKYNTKITQLKKHGNKINVLTDAKSMGCFDHVIDATSHQCEAFLLKHISLPFQFRYQICMALLYRDKKPTSDKPFSFIVMDGAFPCIMPYMEDQSGEKRYILTHGKYTIIGTFEHLNEAKICLDQVDAVVADKVRVYCEKDIRRFWEGFNSDRFEYRGYKKTILVKLRTEREFRSAVTYQSKSEEQGSVIHIVPGKITNAPDAAREVYKLIQREAPVTETNGDSSVIETNEYNYVKGGVLDRGMSEIKEVPHEEDKRNICSMQTWQALSLFEMPGTKKASSVKRKKPDDPYMNSLNGFGVLKSSDPEGLDWDEISLSSDLSDLEGMSINRTEPVDSMLESPSKKQKEAGLFHQRNLTKFKLDKDSLGEENHLDGANKYPPTCVNVASRQLSFVN